MSSIIILSQNKKTLKFWQAKLSVSLPIYKVDTAFNALKYVPTIIIVDDYFSNANGHEWLNTQVTLLKKWGFEETIICLSPQFISIKKLPIPSEPNVFYHHFNQSFIDAISKSAA